ncbi:hypothetical protein [Chryseobacterium gleum]|uniref:hypothetical protein n=1 Tax=Chryseobacterium gleum TaxID=250 RepID=UPI0028AD8267|nr:hypothetical protein [Chryseobacterium gleum]
MIKKILVFISLTIIVNIYAQINYNFDYRLDINNEHSNQSIKNNKIKMSYLFNSKNSNYILYLYPDNRGQISDHEKNIVRRFTYFTDINNKTTYQFTQHLSFHPIDEKKINHIVVEKIGENKYSIKCYPKKKNKKTNLELEVRLKPYNEDFIKFYYLDLNQNIHKKITNSLKEKLNGNYNYIIDHYTVDYKNGATSTDTLEKMEKINLKIVLQD